VPELLVPGRGSAFSITLDVNTPLITVMGPFAAGTFVERLQCVVYLGAQTGLTGVKLGFGMSPSAAETMENFDASTKVWFPRYAGGVRYGFQAIVLVSGGMVQFDVDVGVLIRSGARYVVVYHDLTDGTDLYDLYVSVRCLQVVGLEALVRSVAG